MDPNKKYEVKSLARALDVIEAISTAGVDGVGISDVARQVGTTKSNAYAIVQTLCDRGFISDSGDGPTRRYRLGPSFLRLGSTASSQSPLAVVARGVLLRLTAETGLTSRFAVFDRGAAVAIVRQNAPTGIEIAPYLGRRELLHASGVGKALLSNLSDDGIRQICNTVSLDRRTRRTITAVDDLLAEIAMVRKAGFAIDDEEDMEGVFCVAAPVLDHHGLTAGAISVSGLKLDLDRADIEAIGQKVRTFAGQMSAELGYQTIALRLN
jgi:IclR family transcriptional regulator, acetate operon repressor